MELIDKQATIDWLKKVTITKGITFETGFKQIIYDIEQMPNITRGMDMSGDTARNIADFIEMEFFDKIREDDTIDNFLWVISIVEGYKALREIEKNDNRRSNRDTK